MKFNISIFIGICFVLSSLSGCINDGNHINDFDIIVDSGGEGDYERIQDAIEASNANDTIFVLAGVYHEHIFMNTSLHLISDDPYHTIIDGLGTDDVITINTNHVQIEGFTIQNSGVDGTFSDFDVGIDIEGNNTIVNNCVFQNNLIGIEIRSNTNIVTNSTFYNNSDGIYILLSDYNILKNNIFDTNNEMGMYLYSSSYNMITDNNIFRYNSIAFKIKNAQENKVIGNMFKHNEQGLYFCCGSINNLIYFNTFVDNSLTHGYDLEMGNTWYNASINKGNYWDDYYGEDTNDDGIGEVPYLISENGTSQDVYPLINPFDSL